jgi:proteasome lid subunit RPN8/RPN11
MLELGADAAYIIRAEGEKAYPNECCGFVLGRFREDGGRKAEALIPIANAREAEEQYHRFKIEPEDFLWAEKEAAAQGREVLGFYHSHPDHPARPSGYDQDNAVPFYSYIIVSVEQAKAAGLTSWRLSDDREEFFEETVEEE